MAQSKESTQSKASSPKQSKKGKALAKNKGGRPTKYSKKQLQKTKEYFNACLESNDIPYIEEVALLLDVDESTVWEWAEDTENKEEFSKTIKKIKTLQKVALMRQSNDKDRFTPGLIFQLKANHGMKETVVQENVHRTDGEVEKVRMLIAEYEKSSGPDKALQDKQQGD